MARKTPEVGEVWTPNITGYQAVSVVAVDGDEVWLKIDDRRFTDTITSLQRHYSPPKLLPAIPDELVRVVERRAQ